MRWITTILCLVTLFAKAQTRIDPKDINWNPDFRSVTDSQIKFWNKQTILEQGSGVRLTSVNDSTVRIDATGSGIVSTVPTLPANTWIIPADAQQKIGVLDAGPGQVSYWYLHGGGNTIIVGYGTGIEMFGFHGWGFRNAIGSFGPTIKSIAVEPSKPALVLQPSATQKAYLFAWVSPTGDTLGGVDMNGDFILKKPLPQYSGNDAAKAAKLQPGRLYQTGDYLKAVR